MVIAWAEMGISSWDSGADISASRAYRYEYYTTASKDTPYLTFDFNLSEVTSLDSVIDGLDRMELKDSNVTTSYGATIKADISSQGGNPNIKGFSSSAHNIKVSFAEEIDLGRDFDNKTDSFTGDMSIDAQNQNNVDTAMLKFSGSNGGITYAGDVSGVEADIALDVESYLDYITMWAIEAALAGTDFVIARFHGVYYNKGVTGESGVPAPDADNNRRAQAEPNGNHMEDGQWTLKYEN